LVEETSQCLMYKEGFLPPPSGVMM